MSYVIEKRVPMPVARNAGLSATLRAMQVGDSIVTPMKSRNALGTYAARFHMKFVTRAQPDGTCRIWRAA